MAGYDEFFVTPEGDVSARKLFRGKLRRKEPDWFEDVVSGHADSLSESDLKKLELRDREALRLWLDLRELVGDLYPRIQVIVWGAGGKRGSGAEIRFGIPSDIDVSRLIRPLPSYVGRKRWGPGEPVRDVSEVQSSIAGKLEELGFAVGGGYQIVYYPVTVAVRAIEQAEHLMDLLPDLLAMHGLSMDDLFELPSWRK